MDNVSSKELFDELVFILETSLWTWEWSDPNDEEDTSPEHQLCRDIRRMHHIRVLSSELETAGFSPQRKLSVLNSFVCIAYIL